MIFADKLEHTLLRPNLSIKQISDELSLLPALGVNTVVVPPSFVKETRKLLEQMHSKISLCTVIGFPLGYNSLNSKLFEIKEAINDGCDEVDIVLNNTLVADKNFSVIKSEFAAFREGSLGKICKVILETSLLEINDILILTELLVHSNIDFVKTSTGFVGEGARLSDIKAIKERFGKEIKIKASGGIKTAEQVNAFILAGADKIGTSSTFALLQNQEDSNNSY